MCSLNPGLLRLPAAARRVVAGAPASRLVRYDCFRGEVAEWQTRMI